MPPSKRELAYLWDMLNACEDIISFVADLTFEKFAADKKTRSAVERQLLVIGEAAAHLSESFMSERHDIPWKRIIGQRNVLAHEYGEVLVDRVQINDNPVEYAVVAEKRRA